MTVNLLNRIIKNAPLYTYNSRSAEIEREKAISSIVDYFNTLEVGTELHAGSLSNMTYSPTTLRKIDHDKWTGFFYDYGINTRAMAEFLFRHIKVSGYGINMKS